MPSFTITSIMTLALGASVATAQFNGLAFGAAPGNCPQMNSDEPRVEFTFSGGTFCGNIESVVDEGGNGAIAVTANVVGLSGIAPTTIGACTDDGCNDCQTWDIDQTSGKDFSHECMPLVEQPYMLLQA